ncbi:MULTISPECIES: tyrosine-type recombinase/integrase [unclassified Bradyrhizobium]|uniref:tyrosine-type recombinase/integrase n=1 Tax=unclassified Bradyrhizobium TaxID=2631580 RepID=UPI002916597E|nr:MULTISPECIES: integrase arm-type DNA-binding domain-containing protein [unclassified Bradyrhizobium]
MKAIHKLTDAKIKSFKPKAAPYKVSDGGGLYLQIMPTGARYWRYKFRIGGREQTFAIGTYPTVTLAEAREEHRKAASLVQRGGDPNAEKRNRKEEQKQAVPFREVSALWLKEQALGDGVASKTADRAERMVRYLDKAFGKKQIAEVKGADLVELLRKVQDEGKYETRVRLQGVAKNIMAYAQSHHYIPANPFAGINNDGKAFRGTKRSRKKRPALVTEVEFGQLLRAIDQYEGREGNLTGIALKLLALTFVRPGELIGARWDQIDFAARKWSVPFNILKQRTQRAEADDPRAGKPHEVPLARQTIGLLQELHDLTGNTPYLFPGRQSARTMSENTLNVALKAMGYTNRHVAHGFRSSASTLINEARIERNGRPDWLWPEQGTLVEMQLDHNDDSTRSLYKRSADGAWRERTEMMQFWADKIDQLRTPPKPDLRAVAA